MNDLARLQGLHERHKTLRPDAILTPDGPRRDVEVVVDNKIITAIRPLSDQMDSYVIDMPGTVIVPGIIDTHHHVDESFAKAISFGEPAQMWKRVWVPLGAAMTVEDYFVAAKWTFMEALRGGFTTLVDSAQRDLQQTEAILQAADDVGIRLMSSAGINDRFVVEGAVPSAAEVRHGLERHLDLCSKFSRVHPSVACGTIESTSGPMLALVAAFSRETDVCFQVHANEHTAEIQHSLEHFGCRPLQHLDVNEALGPTTLIAHATLVTPSEIRMLCDTGTSISYNPVASAWKGNSVAPALDMIERGIPVGLGTDGTRNDAFRLLDAAEFAQRLTHGVEKDDFSCGAGYVWFDAATRGGARATGLNNITGSIEVGKRADLLILASRMLETQPSWDLEWELVRLYDRNSILATLIDGEPVLLNGQLRCGDPTYFIDEYIQRAQEAVHRSDIRQIHGPSASIRTSSFRR